MTMTIIELRNYLLKPGTRDHFIDNFESVLVRLQEENGIGVLGQFRLVGQANRFVFVRGFESLAQRFEAETGFYGGPVWEKYGPVANSMIEEYHDVHLLRPLGGVDELTCGQTWKTVGEALEGGTISAQTDAFAVDLYTAEPGQRDEMIARFREEAEPAYHHLGIELRGLFVAEMGTNEFKRHPATQDPDLLVVFSAYPDLDAANDQRGRAADAVKGLRAVSTKSLLLTPTLRSPLRYGGG